MTCDFYSIPCHFTAFIMYLKDFFISFYELILNGLVGLLDLIPIPDFLQNVSFSFPPMISFMADIYELPLGMSIAVLAIITRFLIRRIPIIG